MHNSVDNSIIVAVDGDPFPAPLGRPELRCNDDDEELFDVDAEVWGAEPLREESAKELGPSVRASRRRKCANIDFHLIRRRLILVQV